MIPSPALGQDTEPAAKTDEAAELPEQAAARPAGSPVAQGQIVKVAVPITGNVDRRVIHQIRRALSQWRSSDQFKVDGRRPVLILEFTPGQTQYGRGSEFEDALKLARFLISPQLKQVKTVAYLPRSIKGHAALVVAACEQIVMAEDVEFGDASAGQDEDHPIDETMISGYRQIASSRRTVPVPIALGMLDPSREVLRVETEDGSQLVFASELESLRETKTIDNERTRVVFAKDEPGILTGRQAREFGVAEFLASDRGQVAQHLGLPRNALKVVSIRDEKLKAQMIMLNRPLNAKVAETRLRMMSEAIDNGVNFLCLWIDSPGGDVASAARLTAFLSNLDNEKVLTAAYIPREATGTAALVALACDDVIMHSDATLGGGVKGITDEERLDLIAAIEDEIAPRKSRSPSLLRAMVQDDVVVNRYKNLKNGLTEFFTVEELAQLEDRDDWQKEETISDVGEYLQVDGNEAEQLGLVLNVVDSFEGFKQEYGLEDNPTMAEPGWADELVRALASPGLAMLLIVIGMTAVYAEVQMPGIGVGGFVATVAFTLFFWSNFLEGTAGALEIVLFLVGVACLVMEVFIIPGFGIFGLGGGVLMLTSLVLASQTFVLPTSSAETRQLRDSLLIVGGGLVGVVGCAMFMRRYLPSAPLLNQIMLAPPEGDLYQQITEREQMADYRHLVGQRGVTSTQLTPSGKAVLNDELIDVISEGDLIAVGAEIEVVEVHGNRVIVRSLD
ncbi:MAG: NfeD family protein [Pirellulales bacterium]